jgi:hypothetical protein
MMEEDPLKLSGMHNDAKPEIYKNAAKLRENMTEAELKLWEYLKTKPFGYKFRRQHPFGIFVLDFYCHRLRISIEVEATTILIVSKGKEMLKERLTYRVWESRSTDLQTKKY